ncbi:MAG: PASTA domain-containing protein [Acidimicrobiales bacterium]|nr:PASTA domain-containing protein [Acidimicrobiales bacterium]
MTDMPPPLPPPPPDSEPQPEPEDSRPPVAAEKPSRRRRPSARTISRVSLVLVPLLLGAAGGWWLKGALDDEVAEPAVTEVGIAVIRPVEVVDTPVETGVSVTPSVVGLTQDQARAVFVDAGLGDDDVRIERIDTAGEAGLVIDQDPRPAEPLIGDVVLFVSRQAETPDLVGMATADAREELADFGARGVIVRTYVEGATPETVVETTPAAGEPLDHEVELLVAEPPAALFLTELRSAESGGGCQRRDVQINGTIFDDSLTCTPDRTNVDYLEYALNRQLSSLDATIGVSDLADDTARVTFRVLADDRSEEWTLGYGESQEISIDLTGVLRVRLEVTRAAALDDGGGVTVGWGSPVLLGSIEAVDAMRNQPSP